MKILNRSILILLALAVTAGCATMPTGPSVTVMPARGKSFATFQKEDAYCRQWANSQLGNAQADGSNTATGAVAGTAVGAGLGALIGSASGHAGGGALVGAAYGLFVGTASGANADQVYGMRAQRRYDNAYVQCMYSYGNQVPGYSGYYRTSSAPVVVEPVAPPAEVYVEEPPQFIYSPELNLYVAVGVPYDLVYDGREYLYFYGGRWYRSPYYDGPWVFATRSYVPPVLFEYRIEQVRHYRDREYVRYDHDRAHYDGRVHRPAPHPKQHAMGHMEEHR